MDKPAYGTRLYAKHYFHDDFDEILAKLRSPGPREQADTAHTDQKIGTNKDGKGKETSVNGPKDGDFNSKKSKVGTNGEKAGSGGGSYPSVNNEHIGNNR